MRGQQLSVYYNWGKSSIITSGHSPSVLLPKPFSQVSKQNRKFSLQGLFNVRRSSMSRHHIIQNKRVDKLDIFSQLIDNIFWSEKFCHIYVTHNFFFCEFSFIFLSRFVPKKTWKICLEKIKKILLAMQLGLELFEKYKNLIFSMNIRDR